jgi:hypothetical protein
MDTENIPGPGGYVFKCTPSVGDRDGWGNCPTYDQINTVKSHVRTDGTFYIQRMKNFNRDECILGIYMIPIRYGGGAGGYDGMGQTHLPENRKTLLKQEDTEGTKFFVREIKYLYISP